ncbi:arsenite methyltransferase isoform X1 [Salmo salar]|uniref:Arsenite methyltransferase n=2 Tax=Salmo salar TaxID=8030 RepID=A0A1S3L5F7_SALSA|nr:arsenite methyltransferase isoform X1 [Salmo salar]XP_013986208.2 arsenite methyltransferase isoform X1 [Salmo salar]
MADCKKEHGGCGKCCFVDSVIHVDVKDDYGKTLKKTSDLKSNACLAPSQAIPAFVLKALKKIHPEVRAKWVHCCDIVLTMYYGCGLVVPECLEGCRLLDQGSGSGQDCYMLSQLVGEKGHVTGIDMNEDQLEVARKYVDHHTQEFGYEKPNVDFVQGNIEALKEAGLKENSFDIIISNCVVNLSTDKRKVLSDAYRVLKDGGELYFSDVYSSSRLSDDIKNHKVLCGECLGGALWWEDLVRLAQEVGFSPPRLVTANVITVNNMELEAILGDYKFVSATYRLFKIPKISNKGSLVIYNGNITGFEESLEFDSQYTFKVDEVVEVDGEVASILSHSRFAEEFTFQPPGVPAGCSVKKPKVGTVNPFELVLQLGSATVSSATGGCCGAESSCCK